MKLLKKYIHLLLLLCILLFSFKARYIKPISLGDLKPYHDAYNYTLSAYNLYHHHIYGLKLFGQYYSPKYPYGYPLLIIPFYVIFGSQPYNAVYCTLFFSLLSIVFAYLIGKELGNRFTGLIAALFVALCLQHIMFSKYIMSETSSAFLVLFICWLLLKIKELDTWMQRLLLLVLGLVTGFSVSVHITNSLLIPPVLISLLLGRKSNPRSIFKKETIALLGIILALIPMLLYQLHTFGSPLSTGYKIWDSEYFIKVKNLFSFKFFAQPYDIYKKGNFIVYVFALTGLVKAFYPATMVPLILGGCLIIFLKRREHSKQMIFMTFSSILVASLFVFFSFYAAQGSRYILRGVPLLMILAACGVTFSIDKGIFKSLTKESIFSIIILSLFLMTIIPMGIWSFSQPKSSGWIVNRQYKMMEDIKRHIPHNAIIISQFNPVIADHYFTEHTAGKIIYVSLSITRHWAAIEKGQIKPIRYDRSKKYSFLFLPDRTLNPRTYNFIRRALKKEVSVYLFRLPVGERLFPRIQRLFKTAEQKGDRRLFRLYLKDW